MKTLFTLVAIVFALTVSAQEKKPDLKALAKEAAKETDSTYAKRIKELVTVNLDTLVIKDSVKIIQIAGKKYYVAQFAQSTPVFLTADGWNYVLEIINTRNYGNLTASAVTQLINGIANQLPPPGRQ